jgi:hypothetical protein
MVAGGVGVAGVAGGLGGVVVCPERKEANKRNAAARRIKGILPGEVRVSGYRMSMENRERFRDAVRRERTVENQC